MSDLGDFENFDEEDTTGDEPTETPPDADADPSDAGADYGAGEDLPFQSMDVTPVGSDHGVGTIAVSEGLKIAADGEDTCLRAYITADNRPRLRIGTYLVAPYPDGERLFCRVEALEYAQEFHSDDATEIHARRAMRKRGIDEADYKFMATLDPVAVLFEDGEKMGRRMADRVPKPETVVREATDTAEIKTGLKIPDSGVFLGHLAVGGEKVRTGAEPPTIDYRLKDDYEAGDPLVFRHTLVAGGTGSGKTHAAKNVLRQFLAPDRTYEMDDGREARPAVVVFDPQDERRSVLRR